ncbi:hypothetical protein [Elioraea sp.]|uniref:hypothetical protein n=1 Tax=Elioraea sp. TaxID=2185103 RepID=UPI0025C6A663|nr:hypothetical protein [Elioraea sp.]
MRRLLLGLIVLLLASGGASADEDWRRLCTLGGVADRDGRIAIAPQASASTISSVLPDGGLVPFSIERRFEADLAYFALVGRLGDTPGLHGNRVPAGAREAPVLHARATEDSQRTELRIRLPRVETFALWPAHRVIIMVCRPNRGAIEAVGAIDVPIAGYGTAVVGALALVALVLIATAAVRRRMSPGLSVARSLDPLVIAQDGLGYGSISRLQVFFFSLIVFGLLTYIALRTGVVAAISGDVLILMGIAAVGTAGAALVGNTGPVATRTAETERTPADSGSGSGSLAPETRIFLAATGLVPLDRVAQWRDLFVARGEIDIFRVQAVVFSIFVGGTLVISGLEQLAAYEIPPTVLGLLGLSQASYVGGKIVFRRPGDIAELDSAAATARAALAAIAAGDTSAPMLDQARIALGQLRRALALLLEEAVPQARMEALIAAAARQGRQ